MMQCSVQRTSIAHETEKLRAEQIEQLPLTLEKLSDNERNLVDALFFRGMGVREYAREIGVSHTKVRRERDCILEKLKKYFSKS
jgi:RNA polymerase sigma factor (sigma-70 family)